MEELYCVLSTPGLEAYHDQARGWLYTRWLGMHTQASIAQAIYTLCGYLRGSSYTKILSDHSGLVGKWPAESPWLMQPYFDALAAQGVAYFAWVYNESPRNIERPAVAIFKDVASAYEWLRRCVI
jgi:hypothetical protein